MPKQRSHNQEQVDAFAQACRDAGLRLTPAAGDLSGAGRGHRPSLGGGAPPATAPPDSHHLICSRYREIIDFQWPAIDAAALPDEITSWGRVDTRNVVYGICRACLD